jgi:hypothetical protein
MMGRLNHDQRQLFYSFRLEDAVPDDHLVRAIAGVLDLSWVHAELAPYYPKLGRPSIDPFAGRHHSRRGFSASSGYRSCLRGPRRRSAAGAGHRSPANGSGIS